MSDQYFFDEEPEMTLVHPSTNSKSPSVKLYPETGLLALWRRFAGLRIRKFEKVASMASSEVPGSWRTVFLLSSNALGTKWLLWKYHESTLKENYEPVHFQPVAECPKMGVESTTAAKAMLLQFIAAEQERTGLEDPSQIGWGRLLDHEARGAMQELVYWKDSERERFRKEDEEIDRYNMALIMEGLDQAQEKVQN